MSADVGSTGELPGRPTISTPSAGRSALLFVGGLFWLWLLARWVNDWLLPAGVAVPRDQPFVPPSAVEGLAAAARAAGPPVAGLAGALDSVAFAVGTMPALARGAWLTVVLTVASIALGFLLAVPLSVARVYGGPATRWLSLSYTELIRGTPLLAQLFVLFFGLGLTTYVRAIPYVGQGFVPDQAVIIAVVGFVVNSSAYQSEYIRSALQSVAGGQLVAARAVGLSRLEGIRFVVLPQALRYAIPGWSNELVYLIKYSSLAAFITVPELFFQAQAIANDTFRFTAMYTLAALVYLGMVVTASVAMDDVEERVAIPGVGRPAG